MRSKRCRCSCGFHLQEDELELGLGSVSLTRTFGRKRILMSSTLRESLSISADEIPSQRIRAIVSSSSEISPLESLPPALLVRVICGVHHEDLKSLILVSKTIKEASLVAKREYFAYTTPKKKTRAFRPPIDPTEISNWNHQEDDDDIEAPNAPFHQRWTKAKRKEELEDISIALFK